MNYLNTNSALKKDKIFKFSLPVKKTCKGAKECLKFCYATKGAYMVYKKTVDKAHARNFKFSKSMFFASRIVEEIDRRKIKIVRIHDCGDFYNQVYLNKWTEIAKNLPDTRFYAYTKSLQLDFKAFTRLPNTKIIQSFGGKHDDLIDFDKPHARVFNTDYELWARGYVDSSYSDLVALNTKSLFIGLTKH
ncbi:hypothetical protein LCGC14_1740130 [marine sediment metagenome]|uniref:Gene product 88 domain-containing protein n=1 Tax=marine sediment metagenome TaxID=412755 RepID=A0A0F9K6N7_9ZZZZ